MELNGHKEEHAIKIVFDPETQGVSVQFKPEYFKSWDFVLAVLTMAKEQAELQRNMVRMQAMQQQQMVAIQNEKISELLRR